MTGGWPFLRAVNRGRAPQVRIDAQLSWKARGRGHMVLHQHCAVRKIYER